jgi:DNA-binding beta-propeller fold protein YncE
MIAKLRFARFGACCALLALFSGCATKHPVTPATFTYFPPAPDEPRVQFLTSFSSGADLGGGSSFVDFITGKPAAPNALIKPYGLAVKDGKIYVCDTVANAVEVFDLVRKSSSYFAPRAEGRLLMPINITIDADGTRYVADTGRNQVVIFDRNGNYLDAMGTKDEMKPCDVAVTADRLYIADLQGHAVQVYDKRARKLLFTIPRDPKATEGKLFSPTNLALDKQGHLFVSDTGGFEVQVYDLDGKYLRTIGQQGVGYGAFALPKGVAVDRAGLAYVVDARTYVVQIFDSEGKLLMFFGQPGASTRGELTLPAAVKVDYDNVGLFQKYVAPGHQCEYVILVTSQFGAHMVNVYGFLKQTAAP